MVEAAFRRTVVEELLDHSGEIDVYVITGEAASRLRNRWQRDAVHLRFAFTWPRRRLSHMRFSWLAKSILHLAKVAEIGGEANMAMVFLAGVALVATRFGRGPAVAASVLSVLAFDFFFVPPYLTFAVSDSEYLITFAVMLGIGLLISTLAARQRSQLRASQEQEQRTAKLFRMTRQLSELSGTDFLLQTAGRQLKEFFGGETVVYLRESDGALSLRIGHNTSMAQNETNAIVATWVAEHIKMAGLNTDTLPNATALFVPLIGSQQTVGVLGVRPDDLERFRDPEQRRLLETFELNRTVDRTRSVGAGSAAVQVRMQAEQLRNSLLSSVSHDLRTPLTAIAGTASNLREELHVRTDLREREMLQTLVTSRISWCDWSKTCSIWLSLNRARPCSTGSGMCSRNSSARLARVRGELASHSVKVQIAESFPLILVDGFLLEQAFVNLLENASRYTPPNTEIEISAKSIGTRVEIRFADNGPGLPPGAETKVFDKFFRGTTATPDGLRGVGLGLAICQGIVQAHDGKISAANRSGGGAEFVISIPCQQQSPQAAVVKARRWLKIIMSPANQRKPSILLIEDDPAIRDFLRSALTSAGYNLEEAWTGSAALESAQCRAPDLVILDLGLPDMDGQVVLTRLREWLRRRSSSCRPATRKRKRLPRWTGAPMIIYQTIRHRGAFGPYSRRLAKSRRDCK